MSIRPLLAAAAVFAVCAVHVWFWPGGGELAILARPVYTWGHPAPVRVPAPERIIAP